MEDIILESFLNHGETYRILFDQLQNETAVHAYLITGEKGTGKRTLARLMAKTILCSSGGKRPCGVCRNCVLAEKNEHPDLILIEKGSPIAAGVKKDRNTIPIEDIREMIRLCGIRSTDGNKRVVLLFDADKMTTQAQNCLLKTLEEPPSDTYLILATDHTESILPTIISRCRILRTKAWDDQYILSVLDRNHVLGEHSADAVAAAGGSIGRALELTNDDSYWKLRDEVMDIFFRTTSRSDVLKISNQWKDRKQDAEQLFSVLESLVGMLMEYRFYRDRKTDLSAFPPQWQKFAGKAQEEEFVVLTNCISSSKKQLQYSLNFQAVLEKLIFAFIGEGNKWLQ